MAVVPVHTRYLYTPHTEDINTRNRIQKSLDNKMKLPEVTSEEYPTRGSQIQLRVKMQLMGVKENPILTIPSMLDKKTRLSDTLCVLCCFGNDIARIEAQKKAIKLLGEMNPLPRVLLVEGSTDGQWFFDYVKELDGIDYVPVPLMHPNFRNFFCKEMLWNYGAHVILDNSDDVKYLMFLDADTFFVDRGGWVDIRNSLELYDVVSPYMQCYYTGCHPEAFRYKLMASTGFNNCHHCGGVGYQGFGIGMSVDVYRNCFQGELPNPSLGLGDNMLYYMILGNTRMKGFRLLPYTEESLRRYIFPQPPSLGSTNQILGHIDHGKLDTRAYEARSQLMKMTVRDPLSETARLDGGGYLIGWANNPPADDLRHTFERMLIDNRREIKIRTYKDAEEYYMWTHGYTCKLPTAMRRNNFTQNHNEMPNWQSSIPVPSNRTSI